MNFSPEKILHQLYEGESKAIARCISIVENELEGSDFILQHLQLKKNIPVVGITGPPGAGKSSLVNLLVKKLIAEEKKIGIIAVDPTSPFNFGSLLGDRIRLSEHFTSEKVFIRSLATRGSLGGLSEKIMEVTDVMSSAGFDFIFVETVGVGQSEVEIAGLADTTVVVLVPEAGDEVQTMKAGLMEIADVFVVNKCDREQSELFMKNLLLMVHERVSDNEVPVLKTSAANNEGIDELLRAIENHNKISEKNSKRFHLLANKAIRLIQKKRMSDVDEKKLLEEIKTESEKKDFNIYSFAKKYF